MEKRVWINRYLLQVKSPYSVEDNMVHLYGILMPIRLLVMRVEAGDCSLASIIPLFRSFIEKMKSAWEKIIQAGDRGP